MKEKMMKNSGIIFDLKKYAIHDGPGIRTTVFLKGCPLDCWWCHNPESRKKNPEKILRHNGHKYLEILKHSDPHIVGKRVTVEEVMFELEKDILFYDQSGGGVTFSGGEPLLQSDFLSALLKRCTVQEIHTAVDTSGYVSWNIFENIIDDVNLFLYDIKLIKDDLHKKYTGVSNRIILDNLKYLHEAGARIEIRIPLIPGYTDSDENLRAIAEFLGPMKDIERICLLPYNRIGEEKYGRMQKTNRIGHQIEQSQDELQKMLALFSGLDAEAGLEGFHE